MTKKDKTEGFVKFLFKKLTNKAESKAVKDSDSSKDFDVIIHYINNTLRALYSNHNLRRNWLTPYLLGQPVMLKDILREGTSFQVLEDTKEDVKIGDCYFTKYKLCDNEFRKAFPSAVKVLRGTRVFCPNIVLSLYKEELEEHFKGSTPETNYILMLRSYKDGPTVNLFNIDESQQLTCDSFREYNDNPDFIKLKILTFSPQKSFTNPSLQNYIELEYFDLGMSSGYYDLKSTFFQSIATLPLSGYTAVIL